MIPMDSVLNPGVLVPENITSCMPGASKKILYRTTHMTVASAVTPKPYAYDA